MSDPTKKVIISVKIDSLQKSAYYETPASICFVPGINILFTRENKSSLRVPIYEVDIEQETGITILRVDPNFKGKEELLNHPALEWF